MLFYAHRGYSARFPGNTIPSFEAVLHSPCLGNGLRGVELDIQPTADNQIVVFHDTAVHHQGHRTPICDMPYDQLRNHPGIPHTIPTFLEILSLLGPRAELILDIKPSSYDIRTFFVKLCSVLEDYQEENPGIVLSSFSPAVLSEAMSIRGLHAYPRALILDHIGVLNELPKPVLDGLTYLHPSVDLVFSNYQHLFRTGLPLQVWTVNDCSTYARLQSIPEPNLIRSVLTDDLSLCTTD